MKRVLRIAIAVATLSVAGVSVGVASPVGAQELDLCALLGNPYCPPGEASSDTVVQGGSIKIHGEGFDPGETVDVTICSPPVPLGSFTADADGVLDATVTVPATVDPGTCTIVMAGQLSGHEVEVTVEVLAASTGGGGGLARTGSDAGPLVGIGAGLLAAGGAAAYAARRRAATT